MVLMEGIKDFIQDIEKSKKNIRIYPSNNPIYIKTIDNIYLKMTSLLDLTGDLKLKFKHYDIVFNDDVVYHNDEKQQSLALFFFKDGIRELTFKKGITRDEAEEFMKVLSTEFEEKPDDDLVTLMWEREFQFIQYVVDNTFLLEDKNYEKTAIENVKNNSAGSEKILDAYNDASNVVKVSGIDVAPFTNDDRRKIMQEIENDPPEKITKLIHLIFEMLFFANDKKEYKEITDIIKSTIEYSMENEYLKNVIYIIEEIKRSSTENIYNNEINSYLTDIEYFINSMEFIKLFGNVFDKGAELDDDILHKLADLFSKDAVPHFVSILSELSNISSRKAFIKILSELGKKDVSLIVEHLKDSRWYLVKNIIYILRQIRDKSTLEYISQAVNYPNRKVRIEAIHALGEMGTESVLRKLKDCISDSDDLIRIASIRAMGLIRTSASKKIVLDEIADKAFHNKSFNEKMEFFKVLAHWKENDVIELILKTLNRQVIFKKERNDETRAAAAYCLGMMGIKEAPDVLLKLKNSKNKLLRKNALNTLKMIKNG